MVATRFKRDIKRGTSGISSGLLKSHHLRVRASEAGMVALTERTAFAHNHRAYHGVRFDGSTAFFSLDQGHLHPKEIFTAHAGSVLRAF
jgi:hypothetical protein